MTGYKSAIQTDVKINVLEEQIKIRKVQAE